MEVRVFVSEGMRESCSKDLLNSLITNFKQYKKHGDLPETFGRDVPFDFPFAVRESGLKHVHIKDDSSRKWHLKRIQFDKTSDTSLIYCQGYIQTDCYLLITLLQNAHNTYRSKPFYLADLADIAESFREKF